jgi:enterochelin esterase family protein
VGGAFGGKSVLECPEYTEPGWLHAPAAPGSWRELAIQVRGGLDAEVAARVWSPAEPTYRMLVAHDGPEYDRIAALGHYTAALVGAGRVLPHHLVLLAPGERNEWYSANPAYARALVGTVLPRLRAELGTAGPVVGMGSSLGALAMLHAQRRYPLAFAGLFLQSGSFFQPRHDRQESGFSRYHRIIRFVRKVLRAGTGVASVPAALTCGLVEENRFNNRDMAQALRRQGYPVELAEVPDAHNYTAWRDAFDPNLTDLLRWVWAPAEVPA